MKLAKVMVAVTVAVVFGTSSAVAAPKRAQVERGASSAATNALRKVPAKPVRVATPPQSTPAVVTPVGRGAVWLPKIRAQASRR
jgi:hypothetical protein